MIFLRYLFNNWMFEFGENNSIEFINPNSKTRYKLILDPYDYQLPIIQVVSK